MRTLICVLSLLVSITCSSQKILTVEECLEVALEKNIQLQKSKNNLIVAKAMRFQAIFNYLPDLNIGGGYFIRNGNYFDNTVDRFITETTRTFEVGARTNVVLFNGLSNTSTLRSSIHSFDAAESEVKNQELLVKSGVLQSYLNILADKENIRISDNRLDLLEAQLVRARKRESVGVGNMEDVYNLQSQLANERLNSTNLNNRLQSDFLTLVQTLQLDTQEEYDIEVFNDFNDSELTEAESYDQIISEALDFSPLLKSSKSLFHTSKYDYHRSLSNFLPRVSAYYSIGSGYSSNGAINPDTGQPEDADFYTQLGYNVQPSIGVQFNIPIFTRFSNGLVSQRARVNMLNAELDIESARITITNMVQQVYQGLVAAQSTYRSAQENLKALDQSYEFVKKRYETGNTDFYTYLESLNNKNRAEVELVNAKFGIVFRKKILNLYRGL